MRMSVSLPIFIQFRKYNGRRRTSHLCQRTKSLRSSPLRGSKSRQAGSNGEDSDSAGATINSRIVGVIKNSKIICGRRPSHTANHIYPAYNAMTKLA
jgi:hypothetical protein